MHKDDIAESIQTYTCNSLSLYIIQRCLSLPSTFSCEFVTLWYISYIIIITFFLFLPQSLSEKKWVPFCNMLWFQRKWITNMVAANQGQVMLPLLKPCLVPEKPLFMSLLSTQVPNTTFLRVKESYVFIFSLWIIVFIWSIEFCMLIEYRDRNREARLFSYSWFGSKLSNLFKSDP